MLIYKRSYHEEADGGQEPGCSLKVRTRKGDTGDPELVFQLGVKYSRLTYEDVTSLADRLDEWLALWEDEG